MFGEEDGNEIDQGKAKGSASAAPAAEGLELQYIDSADIKERANIISATYTVDDQLVSAEAKGFIAEVR